MGKKKFAKLLGKKLFDINNMVNATPSCLKIISKDGQLLNMNPRGLCLIEAKDLKSVLGASVYDIVEKSHREKYKNFNKRVCSGQKGTLIFEIIGLEGTRRWMETYAAPYELTNGEVAHIAITNDITKRLQAEQDLLKQKEALEESSRLATLGQFVGGIAHEVNNPLAIISARSTMLRNKLSTSEIDKEYFEKGLKQIEDTVHRISKIIRNLKTYSRDTKDDGKERHSVHSLLESTLSLCAEKLRINDIELRLKESPEVCLHCRDVQISQVLMNLLNNSLDAIKDLDEKWIEIETSIHEGNVIIRLTDSGPGISEQVLPNIMNPFYTTKEAGQGTGLGLSISIAIAEEHGGSLYYNEKHSFTQFVLELPLYKADQLAA